jgi:serine/threonine-protein kinase TTK/MPS1
MKFSALTKALLNDEPSVVDVSSPSGRSAPSRDGAQSGRGSPDDRGCQGQRPSNPSTKGRNGSPGLAPRVVRLSGSPRPATVQNGALSSGIQLASEDRSPSLKTRSLQELITPAPRSRNVRITGGPAQTGTSSCGSSSNKPNSSDRSLDTHDNAYIIPGAARAQATGSQGSVLPYGSYTNGRTRGGEEYGHTTQGSSLRVKRVGKVTGSFLSGPARRGRRIQSEDDGSPGREDIGLPVTEDRFDKPSNIASDTTPRDQPLPTVGNNLDRDWPLQKNLQHSKPIVISTTPEDEDIRAIVQTSPRLQDASHSATSGISNKPSVNRQQPAFRVPAPPPSMPSLHDQENEPPPTFKRNKPSGFALLDQVEKAPNLLEERMLGAPSSVLSPERKALSTRSQNTPHRPAPPPPKMTVLETATATAGAATTSHSRKRRNHIMINGKTFTRMDCIGRGGSSRVYRVMAENYKIFALKKVTLEDVDETAIRGYKGEIELLKRLSSVDRVVRLFDWEVNDEKQTLSVVSY